MCGSGSTGARCLQVEKRYSSVLRTKKLESTVDMVWTEAVGNALQRRFPNIPLMTREELELQPNRPVEGAVAAIVSTTVSTLFVGFISTLPNLTLPQFRVRGNGSWLVHCTAQCLDFDSVTAHVPRAWSCGHAESVSHSGGKCTCEKALLTDLTYRVSGCL